MQRYTGFSPRTRLARWGLLAIALGLVAGGSLPAAVVVVEHLVATQAETLPWFASRILGFVAYLTLVASVIYGLLLSTGVLDAVAHRPISFALHKDLSMVGLGLSGLHGALLLLDRTIHFTPFDVLVPFTAPYRPAWVGFGQIALLLAAVVVGSFSVRRRIGQRRWRLLHGVTFIAFAAAAAHGIGSGTDSSSPWAWWLYVLTVAAVTGLTVLRLALVLGGGRRTPPLAAAQRQAPAAFD
jgi:predicted ferric reductase